MLDNLVDIAVLFGVFGWGMYVQEMVSKWRQRRKKEHRIVIDAPFSPEQAGTIMSILQEINEAVRKS